MVLLIFALVVILYVYSLTFRLIVSNPFNFFKYLPKDVFNYFSRYKDIPKKPFINVYCGLFGSGKTLSAVHDAVSFYYEYNDKKVYDDRIKEYVTQKVFILSNVDLKGVPYRRFTSLQQIVNIGRWRHYTDKKKKIRTITIVVGDEFSVQMNSRNFSGPNKNIDAFFLNALLTSRHALIHGFYLTSQRFEHMDALLRQVSTNVIECKKVWRIQKNTYYDAYEREHASDPASVPKSFVTGFFVRDRDYDAYDTLQVVENLAKSCQEGDMIPEKQVRERISNLDRHGQKEKPVKKGLFGRSKDRR